MFKKIFINILYKLIRIIEFVEYFHLQLNENDVSKKIIYSTEIDINVKSDTGYVKATHLHKTQPYKIWEVHLDNGQIFKGADKHILFTDKLEEIFIEDLQIDDILASDSGPIKVLHIKKTSKKMSMFDLTIDHPNHRYYTSGLLSHNTVSAAITILHFITFNNDKTVMIVANKGDTVIEILSKIKDIYKLLPFFLQAGITNLNQRSMIFGDTGCRIKSAARSKEPAIGFTIDFLYLDEFAHIPRNIIEPYYRAVYPTVSAVKNSKIVITSTPNGLNLFYRILIDAERKEGDYLKNNFKALRVYWDQVPGRHMTYVMLSPYKLQKYGFSIDYIQEELQKIFDANLERDANNIKFVERVFNSDKNCDVINILNRASVDTDDVRKVVFLTQHGEKVPITKIALISSWKEEAIRDIGSVEAFNQEYGLQFIAGSKLLFDEKTMNKLVNRQIEFEYQPLKVLSDKLQSDYLELEWIKDNVLFNVSDVKKYKIVMSVDLAEGLGQDYTVINIFRVVPKSELEMDAGNFSDMYSFFRLEQIGIYRYNLADLNFIAHLLYCLIFDFFDSENVRVVLEYNTYGESLLSKMSGVFNGINNYGSFVFFRYYHKADADKPKIGLKVNNNKKLLVKDYQYHLTASNIVVHEQTNIYEIKTFVKEETSAGNLQFHAESGHDDAVMTLVNLSTVFAKSEFKSLIEDFMNNDIPEWQRKKIEELLDLNQYASTADYSALKGLRSGKLPVARNRQLPPKRF